MIYFIYFRFSLTSYSPLVAGKNNKFISFRERSPDNHTQFQTKVFKIYTRFSDQNGSKTILFWAAHTYITYIGEYPPPRELKPTSLV